MEKKKYKLRFETEDLREEFYDKIRENLVVSYGQVHDFGDVDNRVYLFNECALLISKEEYLYLDLDLGIFHKNSLEKIVETGNLLKSLSEAELEERDS